MRRDSSKYTRALIRRHWTRAAISRISPQAPAPAPAPAEASEAEASEAAAAPAPAPAAPAPAEESGEGTQDEARADAAEEAENTPEAFAAGADVVGCAGASHVCVLEQSMHAHELLGFG